MGTYIIFGMGIGREKKIPIKALNGLFGISSMMPLAVSAAWFFATLRCELRVTRPVAIVEMRTGNSLKGCMLHFLEVCTGTDRYRFVWVPAGLSIGRHCNGCRHSA